MKPYSLVVLATLIPQVAISGDDDAMRIIKQNHLEHLLEGMSPDDQQVFLKRVEQDRQDNARRFKDSQEKEITRLVDEFRGRNEQEIAQQRARIKAQLHERGVDEMDELERAPKELKMRTKKDLEKLEELERSLDATQREQLARLVTQYQRENELELSPEQGTDLVLLADKLRYHTGRVDGDDTRKPIPPRYPPLPPNAPPNAPRVPIPLAPELARYEPIFDAVGQMLQEDCTCTHIGGGLVLTAGHCFRPNTTYAAANFECPNTPR